MNLADYLSELLGQHDEVSVPGLGYFVRIRVNGYFSDKEAKLYPPHHQVKFVPELRDDDVFTQYVADKKNISLASSKYFAEKFIINLREQAAKGSFIFADLGMFKTEQEQLVFKPNDKITPDPAFYGYAPVNIYKIGAPVTPAFAETTTKPAYIPATTLTVPSSVEQPAAQEQYFEEEIETKKPLNVWLILLIAIAVLALAAFGFYKFFPNTFDKVYRKVTGKEEVVALSVVRHEVKVDTAKKTPLVKDTTAKIISLTVDSAKLSHWEVILGAYRKPQVAETALLMYKNNGVKAKILNLTDAPGVLIKVSAGSYPTRDEAEVARLKWVNAGKIKPNSYSIEIKPQQ